MRLYLGHDDDEDRDYLLTVFDDGTHTIATRYGKDQRGITWSPPTVLEAAD